MNRSHRRLTLSKNASKPISGNGARPHRRTREHGPVSAEPRSAGSVSLARQGPSKPPRRKNSSASSSKLKIGSDFSPLPTPRLKTFGRSPSSLTINQRVLGRVLWRFFSLLITGPLLSPRPRLSGLVPTLGVTLHRTFERGNTLRTPARIN